MRSLSTEEQEIALAQLYWLRYWREKGESEEQIATQRLGFESIERMYRQMKGWGWPDWTIYPVQPKQKQKQKQKPRSTGSAHELPPTAEAVHLFRDALNTLFADADDLKHRKETYITDPGKDKGLFDATYEDTLAAIIIPRGERWREVPERLGIPPNEKSIFAEGMRYKNFEGASPAPPAPLPALIAAYLLAGKPLQPLVEALHPEAHEADLQKIEDRIQGERGLSHNAEQIAILIRGGKVGRGTPPTDTSPEEQRKHWEEKSREKDAN
jgi:hypothetical protein